jgi:hypothetical protein
VPTKSLKENTVDTGSLFQGVNDCRWARSWTWIQTRRARSALDVVSDSRPTPPRRRQTPDAYYDDHGGYFRSLGSYLPYLSKKQKTKQNSLSLFCDPRSEDRQL